MPLNAFVASPKAGARFPCRIRGTPRSSLRGPIMGSQPRDPMSGRPYGKLALNCTAAPVGSPMRRPMSRWPCSSGWAKTGAATHHTRRWPMTAECDNEHRQAGFEGAIIGWPLYGHLGAAADPPWPAGGADQQRLLSLGVQPQLPPDRCEGQRGRGILSRESYSLSNVQKKEREMTEREMRSFGSADIKGTLRVQSQTSSFSAAPGICPLF